MCELRKLWVIGSRPPPVGGVTVFIKYFSEAVEIAGLTSRVDFGSFSFSRVLEGGYHCVHVNVSSSLKRLALLLFFKMLRKKVFFVKHGGCFNLNDPFVWGALRLADGVFCLNTAVRAQLRGMNVNGVLHSTVFKENAIKLRGGYPITAESKDGILFYINNSKCIDGEEIYGGSFFIRAMEEIKYNGRITVIDLSGEYREEFKVLPNICYSSEPADFCKLLSEHEIYVRCTATDGMSVALLEAGLLGVKCLASDVVPRPDFVRTYKYGDLNSFIVALNEVVEINPQSMSLTLTSVHDVVDHMMQD
ncbi:hypothetical protein [Halopseudomonas bauzanensis]|uniref:hypothetical protein n=1 Tax=Halopseudomonas bauzanensis TaxID=653930 RepID=UPI002557571F|nr:hypothetical protein [Halopseudomonas bauzanensis]